MPAELAMAATSVINGVVNNLFQSGVKNAQIGVLDAQKAQVEAQTKLNQLSNAQKQELAAKLQAAQSDNERFGIMLNQLTQLGVAGISGMAQALSNVLTEKVKQQAKQQIILAISVIGGSLLLLGVALYIKNK